MAFETILTEVHGAVALIRLNRPGALNALNQALLGELAQALEGFEADGAIRALVLTGSDKAFAAGADIKEMAPKSYLDTYLGNLFAGPAERTAQCRKPILAAVAGYALGGGCELAMMCDFIVAADNAKFGQPEINLGVMPGMGGSQRLTRLIGRSKAMDMCLTGRMMDAVEAERAGLVSRLCPLPDLVPEALKIAQVIAEKSLPIAMMAKEAVHRADELSLAEGIRFERRMFHAMFATEDQKEGMSAFIEKRKPEFKHK